MIEQMNNNKVRLRGRVASDLVFSHEICDEKFYEFNLNVERLSEINDNLVITISEKLLTNKKFTIGDKVYLDGQFRSYNKIIDNKSKLMLNVFVKNIYLDDGEDLNDIEVTGYICKQPVYRMTPFKREICDLLLAVNRGFNKSDYLPCIAWGRNAKFISEQPIGTKINLRGRIQSRIYQKKIENDVTLNMTAYEISIGRVNLAKEELGEKVEILNSISVETN